MPSQLKSDTARANGAKSSGPKTPEGLEKSSRNALRHGFTAHSSITLQYENPEEFQKILTDYRAAYQPGTAAEEDLVDQMVAARWRIRRIWVIETGLLDAEIALRRPEVKKKYTHCDASIELALAFRSLADESRSLHLVSRYESRLFRMYDRAYATLRELQQQRKSASAQEPDQPMPLIPEAPLPVPPEKEEMRNEPTAPPETRAPSLEESQRLPVGHDPQGPPDIADVFLGVIDSKLLIDRGHEVGNLDR